MAARKQQIVFGRLLNTFSGYPLSQELDAFQWLLHTAAEFHAGVPGTPGVAGVYERLYGLSAVGVYPRFCDDYGIPENVEEFLRLAFLRTLIDTSGPACITAWRARYGITLAGKIGLTRVTETAWRHEFTALYGYAGRAWRESPNRVHPDATTIQRVYLTTAGHGWQVIVNYGFAAPQLATWRLYLLPERVPHAATALRAGLARLADLVEVA